MLRVRADHVDKGAWTVTYGAPCTERYNVAFNLPAVRKGSFSGSKKQCQISLQINMTVEEKVEISFRIRSKLEINYALHQKTFLLLVEEKEETVSFGPTSFNSWHCYRKCEKKKIL